VYPSRSTVTSFGTHACQVTGRGVMGLDMPADSTTRRSAKGASHSGR
jgi:hypothetical protein